MPAKRILFVSHSSPLKAGGAETRTREVANRMAAWGHDVTILCGRTNAGDVAEQDVCGVKILQRRVLPDWLLRRFPYPHYLPLAAANLCLMFHLKSLLAREPVFDVIREDISPFPPSGLLALVRMAPAERIAVMHNLSSTLRGWIKFYGPVYGLSGWVMDRLLRSGRLAYDRIICDGQWFATELQSFPRIASRVSYVPNGVTSEFFSVQRPQRERPEGRIRLLAVGRLVETKGHRYLIKAVSRLHADYSGVELDILGSGPLEAQLKRHARQAGVAGAVRFLGPVPPEEMPALYARYDLFVLPSLFEGLPVALIEAMATRLPIIATQIPAVTGVVDDGMATLAASEDAEDLASKLRWAFQHPQEVAAKAERAFRKAQQFDWDSIAVQEIPSSR